jgi:hypothetical protein
MSDLHPALDALYRMMGLQDAPEPQTSEPEKRTTQARPARRGGDTPKNAAARKPRRRPGMVMPPDAGATAEHPDSEQ